ncbi:oligopeptide ABC transporter ATP-binding protein [Candidatus Geothermarchaeota archaeon ex4572_27]|nr:MAG: oligopeptide ABC transporter ATP-binding protein [Candidatus Geothermarchaeota archaeon ex4572_27]
MEILRVEDLKKWFPVRTGIIASILFGERRFIRAVDGVTFSIDEGEVFCLVGESGSGKTTLARLIAKLIPPTSGRIVYRGIDITSMSNKEFRPLRREIQIIFQNPYEALNPRMRVYDALMEPIKLHRGAFKGVDPEERIRRAMEDVRLSPDEYLWKFPHELSGGERQRVAIARSLILRPRFLIADEPVSMLDASVRSSILNLLVDLKEEYNLTLLYITHDLAQAWYLGGRIAVMYLGKIMEIGRVDDVIEEPLHPYTKALISNIPVPDPRRKTEAVEIKGEIPSPINIPSGCRFHPRCPYMVEGRCNKEEPQYRDMGGGRLVACHLYG